ncbi:MAG: hypothetical protein GY798_04375 [Hyphomicrobiales bacterium]|nr:hypothetical protein [Hyphomicrobiales bacterium]
MSITILIPVDMSQLDAAAGAISFADYFVGSTAMFVVRHAHCSAVVVRNQS